MIDLAVAWYRAFLWCLPAGIRATQGKPMTDDFRSLLEEARGTGRWAVARAAMGGLADVVRRAPVEYWLDRERHHRRERRLNSLPQDIRFAVRGFRRQPGVTAMLLLTLTLGMAAAIAVFALVDGVVLRPLPFAAADRLVYLNETAPAWNLDYTGINNNDFVTWRKTLTSFEHSALYQGMSANLADPTGAERVLGAGVTSEMAAVLGIRPLLGRMFTPEEDRPGAAHVVVIGRALWRDRFGSAPDVLGKPLLINSEPYTIIGVLPAEAEFPDQYKFWVPLALPPDVDYESYSYVGIGRLKPGVSLAAARADLLHGHQSIWNTRDKEHNVSPVVELLKSHLIANFRVMTMALSVGVVLVLLCACANVASTFLARAIVRQREMALRLALGADAARVGRMLAVESVVLASVAALLGAVIGFGGLALMLRSLPEELPHWMRFSPDWRVALAAIGVVGVTALLFGLGPAAEARRQEAKSALGGLTIRGSLSARQRRLLHGFVVAEVALASVLLVTSGLLARAYQRVRVVDPGFHPEQVLSFRVALPEARYPDSVSQVGFFDRLERGIGALPGVQRVGRVSCGPMLGCHTGNFYQAEAEVVRAKGEPNPVVLTLMASPGYIETMGIRVVQGRSFTDSDVRPEAPRSVLISEAFALVKWPDGRNPVGRWIRFNGDTAANSRFTVVGVVANVRHYGLDQPVRPTVYLPANPALPRDLGSAAMMVRTTGLPTAIAGSVRAVVRSLDPDLPVFAVGSMEEAMERSLAVRRVFSAVLAIFAALALILAVGGIYGVVSYVAGRRAVELGIRMALGARRGQVVGLVVRQGIGLVGGGLLIGLPAAVALGRVLASKLEGVVAFDPLTLAASALPRPDWGTGGSGPGQPGLPPRAAGLAVLPVG